MRENEFIAEQIKQGVLLIMSNNNGLATTASGALVATKLVTVTGATATGIATATGGAGITTLATTAGTATSVAIADPVAATAATVAAVAAPVVAVGALVWWLARRS